MAPVPFLQPLVPKALLLEDLLAVLLGALPGDLQVRPDARHLLQRHAAEGRPGLVGGDANEAGGFRVHGREAPMRLVKSVLIVVEAEFLLHERRADQLHFHEAVVHVRAHLAFALIDLAKGLRSRAVLLLELAALSGHDLHLCLLVAVRIFILQHAVKAHWAPPALLLQLQGTVVHLPDHKVALRVGPIPNHASVVICRLSLQNHDGVRSSKVEDGVPFLRLRLLILREVLARLLALGAAAEAKILCFQWAIFILEEAY
mmetsp:Transcript_65297/g.155892  ORF Transcript_65297/g.155892 Transcript_65297/m.155892 type:complete len:259 (-) Transcript_65297:391-1167(-)